MQSPPGERNILVIAHTGRSDSLDAAILVVHRLRNSGARPVLCPDDKGDIVTVAPDLGDVSVLGADVPLESIELVFVLGGDGTILRAAEIVRAGTAPLLGVNLGHVGFLAESERDDLDDAVARALDGDYAVEERMTLQVRVTIDETVVYETWALNEATVEKGSRERMLEVMVGVDGRPLSSFGCDGIVVSTPTGSTAYAFSGGGPVVWPSVEAMLLVPLSAHALFARPLVVGPSSSLAVEVKERTDGVGVLWADGRRAYELPPGARVVYRRSPVAVRFARLHDASFTDRLVHKFGLPIRGWRGSAETE
ncbi:NAD kinase [Rathayibacter tritici]|uniref:NAD kinase n=1 Tax=Rathayibacter tritici TaxID=33888 RepID=UPI000CE7F1B8|nr:NAD kinase [Rathayibacter tritici]PPF31350.1 NAD kinase [Rathayibacter tritici]PPI12699.1 NAD kinase [Rathayibacter tritici]